MARIRSVKPSLRTSRVVASWKFEVQHRPASVLAAVAAGRASTARPGEKVWRVRWSDSIGAAGAIARKLLAEPDLAREVFKILRAEYDHNRRSDDVSEKNGGRRDSRT